MASELEDARVCAVCKTVLDGVRLASEKPGEYTWHHTTAYLRDHVEDHEPVPVPMGEFESANAVCDFCTAPEVAVAYRLQRVDFTIPGGGVFVPEFGAKIAGGGISADWCACAGCARWIDEGNQTALVERVAKSLRRKGMPTPPEVKDEIRRLYDAVFVEKPKRAAITALDPFGQHGLNRQ